MESMGNPNSLLGLELTPGVPTSDKIENMRELPLLDMFNPKEVGGDTHLTDRMDIEGNKEDPRPIGGSSIQQSKYTRLSQEQYDLLEANFQQNHYPNKETKQALADTLKVPFEKVHVWFVNYRSSFKKNKVEPYEKELNNYKRQVESLTNKKHHLRRKIKKLRKKINKLKLKQTPYATPSPLAEEQQQ